MAYQNGSEEYSMTRPWIKLHTTTLDDVRLLRLNERQQLRYYQMYLLAGRLNADGSFTENGERLNETDIAIKLRIADAKQFVTDFKALKSAGLIKANGHGPYLAAFVVEQVDWSKKQEQERERKARQRGHDNVTRDANVTETKSRNRHALVTPLDQTKTKKKIKKEKKIKNPPPPKPSSSKRRPAALVVGGGNKSSSSSTWMQELNDQERELAQVMHPILRSCGLGQAKIEKLIPSVATRIKLPDAKRITLAAIASVYADDDVRNKAIVAAHRIENDQVPLLFMNSSTWQVIPAEVLQAADVNIDRSPRAMREDVIRKVASNVANR
jgi:hypothetical protein